MNICNNFIKLFIENLFVLFYFSIAVNLNIMLLYKMYHSKYEKYKHKYLTTKYNKITSNMQGGGGGGGEGKNMYYYIELAQIKKYMFFPIINLNILVNSFGLIVP